MIPYSILIFLTLGSIAIIWNLHVHVSKISLHNVPVIIPLFAFFWFNIHEIVQIMSLNLMFIWTVNAVSPPIPGILIRLWWKPQTAYSPCNQCLFDYITTRNHGIPEEKFICWNDEKSKRTLHLHQHQVSRLNVLCGIMESVSLLRKAQMWRRIKEGKKLYL